MLLMSISLKQGTRLHDSKHFQNIVSPLEESSLPDGEWPAAAVARRNPP